MQKLNYFSKLASVCNTVLAPSARYAPAYLIECQKIWVVGLKLQVLKDVLIYQSLNAQEYLL